jgi:hypothetical protein
VENGKYVGDLEIDQDFQFQQREWAVEFVGWVVIGLILLAALLGLLGPGPLSNQIAGERGSSLWAEYQRFAHYQSPTTLKLHVKPGNDSVQQVRLWLSHDFIDKIEFKHIEPQPERVESWPNQVVYTFHLPEPDQLAPITFYFEPNDFGPTPISLGLEAGAELQFSQFYFP